MALYKVRDLTAVKEGRLKEVYDVTRKSELVPGGGGGTVDEAVEFEDRALGEVERFEVEGHEEEGRYWTL